VEEEIRQCKAYIKDALHGQEQLREIHNPEADALVQKEEEEIKALENKREEVLQKFFGGGYGTSLATHGMLLSV